MEPALYERCSACGTVQRVPPLRAAHEAACCRCSLRLPDPRQPHGDPTPTFAAALAALILYPFAITLPILSLERLGQTAEASVWSGSVGLVVQGELFVGSVVLLCSVVLPLVKLISLLLVTGLGARLARHHRLRTWHLVERTGRWGMLDVLLVAVLVAWLKLGDLVRVSPGPGAVAFTLCVLLSLLASALFDPRSIWHEAPASVAREAPESA